MPAKIGVIPNMGDVSQATRVQLSGARGARRSARRARRGARRTARKARKAARKSGRKLKFGSPAWRKKYAKKGRKRRRAK
jgi:hypothetical protein